MTRPEAEKLLGGYATGTLTEAEKSELFSAALDHQELFDALADEEVLREILADPGARQRLLAALPAPAREGWWAWLRRPAAIGLAASLAGALVVGVALRMYTHRETPPVVEMAKARTTPAAAPAEDAPKAMPPLPQPQAVAKRQDAKPNARREEKFDVAQPEQLEQLAMRARSANSAENRLTDQSVDRKEKALEARGAIGGVVGGVPSFAPAAPPAMYRIAKDAARVEPTATLERIDSGYARLTVTSPAGGVLYVASRKGASMDLLTAQQSIAGPSGTTEARYEVPLMGVDAVDVYVLPVAVSNPLTLPADGSRGGYYRRVYPDEKTLPKP